jgi:hypothetical protein
MLPGQGCVRLRWKSGRVGSAFSDYPLSMPRGGRGIIAENKDDAEAREREEEIARYRRAAEETLGQLAWCVNYLHRIRKGRIAELIDANCRHIRREMSGAGG